jgi:hypothetical protein
VPRSAVFEGYADNSVGTAAPGLSDRGSRPLEVTRAVSQAEWWRMWEQCLRATDHRIVPSEAAKYVTKPGRGGEHEDDLAWCDDTDPDGWTTVSDSDSSKRR